MIIGRCKISVLVVQMYYILHYFYTTFDKTKKHGVCPCTMCASVSFLDGDPPYFEFSLTTLLLNDMHHTQDKSLNARTTCEISAQSILICCSEVPLWGKVYFWRRMWHGLTYLGFDVLLDLFDVRQKVLWNMELLDVVLTNYNYNSLKGSDSWVGIYDVV